MHAADCIVVCGDLAAGPQPVEVLDRLISLANVVLVGGNADRKLPCGGTGGGRRRCRLRWSIARRGYLETNIVTGRDEDEARSRLFAARPDLLDRSMVAEAPL